MERGADSPNPEWQDLAGVARFIVMMAGDYPLPVKRSFRAGMRAGVERSVESRCDRGDVL